MVVACVSKFIEDMLPFADREMSTQFEICTPLPDFDSSEGRGDLDVGRALKTHGRAEEQISIDDGFPRSRYGRTIKPVLRYGLVLNVQYVLTSPDADRWKEAMQKEIDSFDRLAVRERVEARMLGAQPSIECKWILRKKDNGKFKARIVVRGFQEKHEANEKNYAPTAQILTLRLLLALAARKKMILKQIDFASAFLNAELDKPVFVRPPPQVDEGFVWKLRKAVYGLRRAPRSWFMTLEAKLRDCGLRQSIIDCCLFYDGDIIVIVYVDDLIIASSSAERADQLIAVLESEFMLSSKSHVGRYLGLDIAESDDGISINLELFIHDLAQEYDVYNIKATNPLSGYKDYKLEEIDNNLPIRNLVGSLQYVANRCRPDVAFAVSYLSRFVQFPSQVLFKDAKRIVAYLLATVDWKLVYPASGSFDLCAFADASHTSLANPNSTFGVVVKFGTAVIGWTSKKIKTKTTSSTESELFSVYEAYKIIEPVKQLLSVELGLLLESVVIFNDNTSALAAVNHNSFRQTGHIDYRTKIKLLQIADNNVSVEHVESKSNVADVLTKPMTGARFMFLVSSLLDTSHLGRVSV